MSSYEDPNWSEVRSEDSALERERADADWREWQAELKQDRLRRDDPCRRPAALAQEGRTA